VKGSELKDRMAQLQERKEALARRIETADEPPPPEIPGIFEASTQPALQNAASSCTMISHEYFGELRLSAADSTVRFDWFERTENLRLERYGEHWRVRRSVVAPLSRLSQAVDGRTFGGSVQELSATR
jgi:hypothetical protein